MRTRRNLIVPLTAIPLESTWSGARSTQHYKASQNSAEPFDYGHHAVLEHIFPLENSQSFPVVISALTIITQG